MCHPFHSLPIFLFSLPCPGRLFLFPLTPSKFLFLSSRPLPLPFSLPLAFQFPIPFPSFPFQFPHFLLFPNSLHLRPIRSISHSLPSPFLLSVFSVPFLTFLFLPCGLKCAGYSSLCCQFCSSSAMLSKLVADTEISTNFSSLLLSVTDAKHLLVV